MLYSNRFKILEEETDPTDYEEYEHLPPYNLLEDGNFKTLAWKKPHPLRSLISNRFSGWYDGKLMWRELIQMKERIEKLKSSLYEYKREVWPRMAELEDLIREQKKLCNEDTSSSKIDTILMSAVAANKSNNTYITIDDLSLSLISFFHEVDDAFMIFEDILSFVNLETCAQKLKKHLDKCSGFDGTGKYKCTKDHVSYDCQFKENGRCAHYYKIEHLREDLEEYECNIHEEEIRIIDLEVEYNRALAVKENRLQEYYDDLDDW